MPTVEINSPPRLPGFRITVDYSTCDLDDHERQPTAAADVKYDIDNIEIYFNGENVTDILDGSAFVTDLIDAAIIRGIEVTDQINHEIDP